MVPTWCPEPESNRYAVFRWRRILSPLCLPISPPGPNVHCRRLGGRMCRTWDRRQGERSGGAWRSRTALDGFAIRCITALLTRQCRYKKRKPSFLLLQRPAWWTGCESGAGNETCTRALSRCFPITFSAGVISEDLDYSPILLHRRQNCPTTSKDVQRASIYRPRTAAHPWRLISLSNVVRRSTMQSKTKVSP